MIDANQTRDGSTDRRANACHVHYDPGSDASLSVVLVKAIAELADVDPLELEPLHETIDPETLNEFVGTDELPDVEGTVTFVFEGYDVTVYASGLVKILPPE